MRYTKYKYKKKNNGMNLLTSMMMMLVGTGAIGLIMGTVIFNTFWGGKDGKPIDANQEVLVQEKPGNGEKQIFSAIQCGYFAKEENANNVLSSLDKSYNSFVVKDEEKFRVIAGVFTEEDADKVLGELKGKGIDAAKIKFTLNESDKVQEQISAITNGYFEILKTLKDKEVKSVDTSEFKTWTKELPEITEGDKKEVVMEFKRHIEELPSELKNENLTGELEYIYTILNNFKSKK